MTPSSWLFTLACTLPALALAARLWRTERRRAKPTTADPLASVRDGLREDC